jgi:hypothetical protein
MSSSSKARLGVSSAVLPPNFASGRTPTGLKKSSRHHPYPGHAMLSASKDKAKAVPQDDNADVVVEFDMLFYPYPVSFYYYLYISDVQTHRISIAYQCH